MVVDVIAHDLFEEPVEDEIENSLSYYRSTFLAQVRDGNVKEISSTGETVSGELKKEITYPADDKDAEPAKNFDTEIPTFANTDELDKLLGLELGGAAESLIRHAQRKQFALARSQDRARMCCC